MANLVLNIKVGEDGTVQLGNTVRKLEDVADAEKKAQTGAAAFSQTLLQGIGQGIGQQVWDTLVGGAQAAAGAIVDLAQRGSEVSVVSGAFQNLAAAVGESGNEIIATASGMAQGLVSDMGIMEAANKGFLLGLPITAQEMGVLAQTSVALGQAMRVGPEDALMDLITGLGRGSAAILDNLGITLNADEAYEKYAATIGKTADTLTASEKKLAVYKAAMEASGEAVARVGGIQLTFGQNMTRLEVVWDNLVDRIGRTIAESPALNAMLQGAGTMFSDLARYIGDNTAVLGEWVEAGVLFGMDALLALLDVVDVGIDTFNALTGVFQFVLDVAAALWNVLLIGADGTAVLTGGLLDVRTAAENAGLFFDAMKVALFSLGGMLADVGGKILKFASDVASLSGDDELATKLNADIAALDAWSLELSDSAQAVVQGTEAQTQHARATDGLREKLTALRAQIESATASTKTATTTTRDHGKEQEKSAKEIEKARRAGEQYDGMMRSLENSTDAVAAKTRGELAAALQKIDADAAEARVELDKLLREGLDPAKYEAGKKKIEETSNALKAAAREADATAKMQRRLNEEWDRSQGELNALLAETEAENEAMAVAVAAAHELAASMVALGSTFDGAFGIGVGAAGALVDVFAILNDESVQLEANVANIGMAAIQAAAAIRAGASGERSGGMRALGGAMQGAAIGAQFGPQGAIIGALGGALLGFFSGPKWGNTAKVAGRVFGMEVSDELAEAIYNEEIRLNISAEDASLLFISEAIEEAGASAREFAPQMLSLVANIADGSIPAREGLAELGASFALIAQEAQEAGRVGASEMVALIQATREAGLTMPPEMAAVVEEAVNRAVEGMNRFAEGLTGIEDLSAFSGEASARLFMASFSVAMEEMGLFEALEALAPAFENLKAVFEETGNEAALALLEPFALLAEQFGAEGPLAGLGDVIGGLDDLLVGLADSGYLTAQSFTDIQTQAVAAFDAALAATGDQQTALLAIMPTLSDIVSASQEYGFALDENTQALVDQATAAGFAFPPDPMLVMVDLLEQIVLLMGGELPEAANVGAQAMQENLGLGAEQAGASIEENIGATTDATLADVMAGAVETGVVVSDAFAESAGNVADTMGDLGNTLVDALTEAGSEAETIFTAIEDNAVAMSDIEIEIPVVYQQSLEGQGPPVPWPGGADGDPETPYPMASGAVVEPRPGGVLARIGEGGQAEVVAPVAALFGQLADAIVAQVVAAVGQGGGGGVGPMMINLPSITLGGVDFGGVLLENTRNGAWRVHANGITNRT